MRETAKNINDVKVFWESNPLFSGESSYEIGSKEYFEEHRMIYIEDCFAGKIDARIFPEPANCDNVLDLGCGPGFWTVELSQNGAKKITAADLTENAIKLTKKRSEIYGIKVQTCQQNAECLTFADSIFSHVNCQGVIHHTPNTESCVREIARVLRPEGSALISVYYKNIYLRSWPLLKYLAKLISLFGAGMKGRGRECIYDIDNANEIVRMYDGMQNPIGKAYSKEEFIAMLANYFEIEDIFFHFFPARSLPFRIPRLIHKILDEKSGFMIFAKCKKKN